MQALIKLQSATLAARKRTGDARIGTSVESGKVRVELVTPVKGKAPKVAELSAGLTVEQALEFLGRM